MLCFSLQSEYEASRVSGPSAGAAIAIAIVSLAMKRPVKDKFAITGGVTLSGKFTTVGGIKYKLRGVGLA